MFADWRCTVVLRTKYNAIVWGKGQSPRREFGGRLGLRRGPQWSFCRVNWEARVRDDGIAD